MSEPTNKDNPLLAYLSATAEQLDIASEDAEIALNQILETFDAAANCMETLEGALNAHGECDPETLLATTVSLRKMLKSSVVNLQFQDRLMQRLGLASRELRQLAADEATTRQVDPESLKVPRTVSSLYDSTQMTRIIQAAGGPGVFQDSGPTSNDDDDVTLF